MPNETIPNNQTPVSNPKHLKPFWPIFIVAVLALSIGLAVIYIASDSERQEDINSILFMRTRTHNPKQQAQTPKVSPTPRLYTEPGMPNELMK